jgi:hypothetical protein
VKLSTTVTAVLASLMLASVLVVSGPTAASAASAPPGPGPKGYDVAYPQCTEAPRVSLYVNTAEPGNKGVTDWPVNNLDPRGHWRVADPYGRCVGGNGPACAWQYGWNLAEGDAQSRGVPNPRSYRWWLDVETINSWQAGATVNRADLEGMVSYLRHIGARAGIYSTAKQFGPLMGPVGKASPLYRLPDWIPGASTLAQAKKNCRLAPLTGGGTVTLTQWKTKPVLSDYPCPPRRSRAG